MQSDVGQGMPLASSQDTHVPVDEMLLHMSARNRVSGRYTAEATTQSLPANWHLLLTLGDEVLFTTSLVLVLLLTPHLNLELRVGKP